MATTLTRNLKLRLNSNLTADAKYNLERIDTLGSTFIVDSTDTLRIRSRTNILIEPDSADLGGNSTGGAVSIGSPGQALESVAIYSGAFSLSAPLGLIDSSDGGTKSLFLKYKSDLTGAVDTASDRSLLFDLNGADRNIILDGNFELSGGSLTLTLAGDTSLLLPLSGTLATLAGAEVFTNKTINGNSNTLLVLANSQLSGITPIANGGTGASTASQALTNLLPDQTGNANKVLKTDGTTASWEIVSGGGGGSVVTAETLWVNADGTTKVVVHNLDSENIDISIIDLDDNSLIGVSSVVVTDANTVTLTSSEAPSTTWKIVIQANP